MKSQYPDPEESLHSLARPVRIDLDGTSIEVSTCRLDAHPAVENPRRFLLLHGNPSHMDHWFYLAQRLRSRGHVILFDFPGFGTSLPLIHSSHTLRKFAEVAVKLAERFDWKDSIEVIGHSHGGAVAQTLAAEFPERVSSLVLIDSAGYPAHPSYRLLRIWGLGPLLCGLTRFFTRIGATSFVRESIRLSHYFCIGPDHLPKKYLEQDLRMITTHPHILRSMAWVAQENPCQKLFEQAEMIRAPILMIHGERDRLVPVSHIKTLRARFKSSLGTAFEIIPGAGHMPHLTRVEEFAAALFRWLIQREETVLNPNVSMRKITPELSPRRLCCRFLLDNLESIINEARKKKYCQE